MYMFQSVCMYTYIHVYMYTSLYVYYKNTLKNSCNLDRIKTNKWIDTHLSLDIGGDMVI